MKNFSLKEIHLFNVFWYKKMKNPLIPAIRHLVVSLKKLNY